MMLSDQFSDVGSQRSSFGDFRHLLERTRKEIERNPNGQITNRRSPHSFYE